MENDKEVYQKGSDLGDKDQEFSWLLDYFKNIWDNPETYKS